MWGEEEDPYVLRWGTEHPVFQLCINIGYIVYNVLGYGIPMVRFYGLCDGKIMVRKTIFSGFCVEMSKFFAKTSARNI